MTVITNAPRHPGDQPFAALVSIELVGEAGAPIVGYVTGTAEAIQARLQVRADGDNAMSSALGEWAVDLVPNDSIEPAGTVYRVTEQQGRRAASVHIVEVPAAGGPYTVLECLSELPGALPSPPLLSHLTDALAAHGASAVSSVPAGSLAATNVQDALDELDAAATAEEAARIAGDAALQADVDSKAGTVAGEYLLTDYGAVDVTGVAHSNDAWDACIAAWYAGGGGTIKLPVGRVLVTTQTILPSGNPIATGATQQPPLTLKGVGGHMSGQNQLGTGGSRLILTYQGAGDANPMDAQIVTRGLGILTFDAVVLQDTVPNSETPFVSTTNTTIHVQGSAFLGATVGVNCRKDAFILGGTLKPIGTGFGDSNSAFQGYGTVITGNYFNRVRRIVYGRSYCNQTQTVFNYIDKGCGTNLVNGACVEFDATLDPTAGFGGDTCFNNVVMGNYFHWVGGYYYIFKGKKVSRSVVAFNGFIDAGPNHVAGVRLEGVTPPGDTARPSTGNTIIGNASAIGTTLSEDALSLGLNISLSSGGTDGDQIAARTRMSQDAKIVVQTLWRVTNDTTDFLRLTPTAGGTWTVGASLVIAGNAAGATTTVRIGNNATASPALLELNAPSGQLNSIQVRRGGVASWLFYDANSTSWFFRDSVNAKMHLTFSPGAGTGGLTEVNSALRVNGNVGFFNQVAIAKRGATADASDLATVITLANAIKADLIAYGLKTA